jgi:hypothetical protein
MMDGNKVDFKTGVISPGCHQVTFYKLFPRTDETRPRKGSIKGLSVIELDEKYRTIIK